MYVHACSPGNASVGQRRRHTCAKDDTQAPTPMTPARLLGAAKASVAGPQLGRSGLVRTRVCPELEVLIELLIQHKLVVASRGRSGPGNCQEAR
jgi:hypothetical protein